MVKVNLLMVALVLLTAVSLFVSSERSFQKAVFDPCAKKLLQAESGTKALEPYFPSFLHCIGTKELNAAVARNLEDGTSLRAWMEQQPSMDGDPATATLAEDYERFFVLMDYVRNRTRIDSILALLEKDGKTYSICISDSYSYLASHMNLGGSLELFGVETEFLPPEDFLQPNTFQDGETRYMMRCLPFDLGGGDRRTLWSMLDMTDETQEHRQFLIRSMLFVVGLTLLAAVISILLMRRLVVRPIQRLALGTKRFTPEEDGSYSLDKVITADVRTGDELGDLSRDIRAMQEGIVDNTQRLAQLTAEKERVKTELNMATMIQASALPHVFPAFPDRTDFTVYASMTPAKEVGGDFYDFFLIDDTHLGIVMADVSDKGVPAALFMMTSRTLVQIYAKMGLSPSQTLHATNEWLRTSNKTSMFFTVWFGILDLSTGVITAVNGGHEYPVLRCGGQPYDLLKDRHGLMVGVSARAKYTDYEIRLVPGDRLFLYTDGVPEAQTADAHMFGTERMLQALNADPDAPPERLLANVRAAVDSFIGGAKQFDDLTMLCLEYRGPRANPEAEGDAP